VIDWSEAGQGNALYNLATLTLGHEDHLGDVVAGYGTDVDLDVIRAWWSLRSLQAVRWLVDHGFRPSSPGCEVDVLRSRLRGCTSPTAPFRRPPYPSIRVVSNSRSSEGRGNRSDRSAGMCGASCDTRSRAVRSFVGTEFRVGSRGLSTSAARRCTSTTGGCGVFSVPGHKVDWTELAEAAGARFPARPLVG
jgi:hypothetical protein